MPTKECLICGTEFQIPQYRLEIAKYCSRDCRSKGLQGRDVSEETRKKMSKARKGGNSGSFKKGSIPWHKGKKVPQMKGSTSFKKGNIPWNQGMSVQINNALDKWRKTGGEPWNKGKTLIPETIEKIRLKRKEQQMPKGDKHWNWNKNHSYSAVHKWLVREYGNSPFCEFCLKKGKYRIQKNNMKVWIIDWANISGEYKREREDYRGLCRKCHIRFDNLLHSEII